MSGRVNPVMATWLLFITWSCSCGTTATTTMFDFGDADTAPGAPKTPAGGKDSGVIMLAPPSPVADCPVAATLIYVTGEGSALYSFDPETGTFTHIGILKCLDSPTHMTVDRQAVAWVVSDGKLYKASTADASCSAVSTWTPDAKNFSDFALTFLGTTNATDDALYLLGASGELGNFNPTTGTLTDVGSVFLPRIHMNASGNTSDMTTNGDGTLYVTDDSTPAQTLNQVDPTSASLLATYVTGENDSASDGALAYYGGLFFDFVGKKVFTFDTQSMALTPLGTAPLQVTGAGQSTCVPTDAGPPAELR